MEPRISLLTLGVDDLERSLVFYRDGLGLPSEDVTGDVVFFKLQGAWISLYANESLERDAGLGPGVAGFSGITIAHNFRTRDEVDRLLDRAEEAGASITASAKELHWGCNVGYFADPDGHIREITWNPQFWID